MSEGSPDRTGKRSEEELASKQINVQQKRYYIDVKQNQRGRFIKIAELGVTHKSRLVFSMVAAVQVRDHLKTMTEYLNVNQFAKKKSPSNSQHDGNSETSVLKSEALAFDSRRYFMDLKQNSRGRFLRISQIIVASPVRQKIAIPEEGIAEIYETLCEYVDKFSEGFLEENSNARKRFVSGESKTFYFERNENDRGQFVRITEVKSSGYRTSITLPVSTLEKFRASLDEVIAEINEKDGKPASK